ncbi:MAG: IS30 family transposase [Candidatus Delongbacteria bacterium]|nr:IS30 family transposase [Candidatus Delongbacteria bacterium]
MKRSETKQRERKLTSLRPLLFINAYICTPLKVMNMKHLTKEQRCQIKAYLQCGKSKIFIAEALEVHKTTIYREISRNSTKTGIYNPDYAQEIAIERKDRFNLVRKFDDYTQKIVKHYIENEQWSPEQIVGHCKSHNIPMVCHERIYAYIRKDKLNGGSLYKHLRHRLKHRKRPVGGKKVVIKDKVSIDKRSNVINNKERFGDWEIDLIVGEKNKDAIVTIAERKTAFFMMKKLPDGKNAKQLSKVVVNMLLPYKDYIHSITSDNGSEFAEHKTISKRLKTQFFFAHPYSSWERGLNEYTNKLIRQYIPKKESFTNFNDLNILDIQHKINRRPRKNLNFKNPKNLFFNFVNNKVAFDT